MSIDYHILQSDLPCQFFLQRKFKIFFQIKIFSLFQIVGQFFHTISSVNQVIRFGYLILQNERFKLKIQMGN